MFLPSRVVLLFTSFVFLAVLSFSLPLQAQDLRTVVEPHLPPTCKVLLAELTPRGGTLSDGVERHYRDTDRLEKAMRHCSPGTAVVLRAGSSGKDVFLTGPLRLSAGVTLVVESNVALWGSRDPRNYDVAPGSCGLVGTPRDTQTRGPGCKPLIVAQDAPHAGIMGGGVIDGRGGARLLFPDGREGETWWGLAHRAKVEDTNQAVSRILIVRHSDDFTLFNFTLRNSPNCHVTLEASDGFTAWGVRVDTPRWARNTDGIDPQAGSTNISIVNSFIRSGDDNISPKSNAAGAVTHMTVRNTHFYNGHGFGIGSQISGGISALRTSGLSIDGSDNGIRIKSDRSRGGLVEDVSFENVCMRDVPNPIVLNPFYTTFEGTRIPLYRNITLRNVHSLSSATVQPSLILAGLDQAHRLEATLDNVVVDGIKAADVNARHAIFTLRHGNLDPAGEDLRVNGSSGGGAPLPCADAFPPFPENTSAPISAEVIPPPDKTFYVAADGTGDFYSVQAAMNRVPATGGVVLVAPGVYRERVSIKQSHVTLKSANPDPAKTTIVFDLSKGTQGQAAGFATVRVLGDDFTAENITFENDFNRTHKQEQQGSQARALALFGDRNILKNVRILGNQDTLYLSAKNCGEATGTACEPGRSFFSRSFISGNVDFIYGDGLAFFESCELHSTEHAAGGYLTAQGKHYAQQESLFVFHNTQLTAEPGVSNVFLGRPWRDLASVVFLNTTVGAHIAPQGWREWHPGETHRLSTAFYRTYLSSGQGVPTAGQQLTPAEAARYTPRQVLAGKDGWNPETAR